MKSTGLRQRITRLERGVQESTDDRVAIERLREILTDIGIDLALVTHPDGSLRFDGPRDRYIKCLQAMKRCAAEGHRIDVQICPSRGSDDTTEPPLDR